jgi:hypothetical protein
VLLSFPDTSAFQNLQNICLLSACYDFGLRSGDETWTYTSFSLCTSVQHPYASLRTEFVSFWFLAYPTPLLWKYGRYSLPKHHFSFIGLHSIISQKKVLLYTSLFTELCVQWSKKLINHLKVTYSKERSPLWKANSHSAVQQIPRLLKKGKAISVTGREGPYGCETSRLPHFL